MTHVPIPIPAVPLTAGTAPLPPVTGVDSPGRGSALAVVDAWHAQGAHWVHFDDLDARAGTGHNLDVVRDVVHHHRGTLHVQLAGGVVDDASLDAALATGASVVAIDVGAAPDRQWVRDALAAHRDRVTAALHVHGLDLVDAAGTPVGEIFDVVLDLEAHDCPRYLVVEAARRGHWRHRDQHVLAGICESVRHPVTAQGGVTHLSDLHQLADLAQRNLAAVVIDEPLYSGRFTLAEAISAEQARYDPYLWAPPRP